MKNFLLAFTVNFFICTNVFGQNFIYNGNKQYEATSTWNFASNDNYMRYFPEIAVAKNNTGGYLWLSVNVPFKNFQIKGPVFVYLSDGSVIKCGDKGIKDYVDNHSIALYYFNMEEIEKLKKYRIIKIRYSIFEGGFEGMVTYTAENTKGLSYFKDIQDFYETDLEISNLFK